MRFTRDISVRAACGRDGKHEVSGTARVTSVRPITDEDLGEALGKAMRDLCEPKGRLRKDRPNFEDLMWAVYGAAYSIWNLTWDIEITGTHADIDMKQEIDGCGTFRGIISRVVSN